jgi:hypothetical protein
MPGLTSSAHPNVSRHLVPRPLCPCQRAFQQIFQRGHQHRAFVSPAESDAISYADRVWRSPWLPAESRTGPLVFFALDLLFLNGVSTAELLLIKRKERLQRLFKKESGGLRYSDNVAPRFSTKPAGSVSKAPSRRRPIVLTSPATAGSGSCPSALIAWSASSFAGQTQRAAPRTQGGLSRCALSHCG